MGVLITRDGHVKITATVESILATCGIVGVERQPGGGYELQYDDMGSNVFWDTSEQIKRDGQLVYQDADGQEYLEGDLILVDDDENGDPITVECDNCEWRGNEDNVEVIKDLAQRVDPGGVVPAGECPECGCLCYLIDFDALEQDKADQKHNAMMLDGCETEDEVNAELRAQTQGR